ncbi:MAG: M48 family metallopeptidase [Phycisphaerales bacterium]|nr:M48 family metallopeptidase [Phycisphaerales bacterium]
MGNAIAAVRFRGDAEGERRLREDESLRGSLGSACWKGSTRDSRRRLLAGAVRVRADLAPGAWRAAERVRERSGDGTRVELYVHSSAEINAAVTCGGDRLLVILTSAAVERLDEEELSFVLGHELGHGVYGHLAMPIGGVPRGMSARDAMRVMAWQRAAEVSADRAGLLCCGSVGAAASALFKSLSGLSLAGGRVEPGALAEQWSELADAVAMGETAGAWAATHPFVPLRARALLHYWESDQAGGLIESCGGTRALEDVDRSVSAMLAMMDPLAEERRGLSDPVLEPFVLWGGLAVALADGTVHRRELENLRSVVDEGALRGALADRPTVESCCERFAEARARRARPLSALDLTRVFAALSAVAGADGMVAAEETGVIERLASACGVSGAFVERALARAA